jgi:hypothetical protein
MQQNVYRTADWSEIIWLMVNQVRLLDTERLDGVKTRFTFADADRCRGLIHALLMGQDQASVSETLNSIRRARAIISQTT